MNLLLVSSNQLHPENEWTLIGTRNLIEQNWKGPHSYTLFDTNPDLTTHDGYAQTHKWKLHSNCFHHQSLIAYDAVVIAGGTKWSGGSLELLYGLIEKTNIPLYGFGLGTETEKPTLNRLDKAIFQRTQTYISSLDSQTRERIQQSKIQSKLTTCPSLFAVAKRRPHLKLLNATPTAGFFLEEPANSSVEQKTLMYCKKIEEYRAQELSLLFCWTSDDFLRFSTMFKGEILYSYQANDYFDWFSRCDFIITNRLTTALVANSFGMPALHTDLNESLPVDYTQYPYILPCPIETLEQKMKALRQNTPTADTIYKWKEKKKQDWQNYFNGLQDGFAHTNTQ